MPSLAGKVVALRPRREGSESVPGRASVEMRLCGIFPTRKDHGRRYKYKEFNNSDARIYGPMSTTLPLASIIIDNYNYGRLLKDAIDSALAQTYRNTEVIVVDDGSTDNSREIIAGYGDRIIPVLKENGGQASALNAGFAVSQGDVILFLDADDVLLPTAAENAMPCFEDSGLVKVIGLYGWLINAASKRGKSFLLK
jgi:cellulose synthase/poly-beta-1,6-N-acetylglucosamine synthase-like glycosyltransferase